MTPMPLVCQLEDGVACICWGRGGSRRHGVGREAPGSILAASELETRVNTQRDCHAHRQMGVCLGGFREDAGGLGIFSRQVLFRPGLGGC